MRNFFILLFLALLGYLLYKEVLHRDPPPIKMYKDVAQAWVDGDMSKIRPLCEEPRTETYFEARNFRSLLGGIGLSNVVEIKYVNLVNTPGDQPMLSRVKADLEVYFNPAGVKSENYASWRGVFDFEVGLKQVGEIWKITSFNVSPKEVGEFRYK